MIRLAPLLSTFLVVACVGRPGLTSESDIWRTPEREGANAIYLWLRMNDVPTDYDEIVTLCNAHAAPLSLLDLRDVARKKGLHATIKHGRTDDLIALQRPVIVYLDGVDGQHGFFALALFIDVDDQVEMVDASNVTITSMSGDSFRRVWTGHYLCVTPAASLTPWFASGLFVAMFLVTRAKGRRKHRLSGNQGDRDVLRAASVTASLLWICLTAGCSPQHSEARVNPSTELGEELADRIPLQLPMHRPKRLDLPEAETQAIRRLSHPLKKGMTASLVLHVLHAHGLDATFDRPLLGSGAELLALFTDDRSSRAFFGEPTMIRTRHGIRWAVNPEDASAREYHRDQLLGAIAELGLPLSTPFQISGAQHTAFDLLQDSIANYSNEQVEIEWTAFAYALYLPPTKSWRNKYGQAFTFDDLAKEVINRPLDSGSCTGSHLVWAMIAIDRADRVAGPLLSAPVRETLTSRLREIVDAAVHAQNPDGSWGSDWNARLLPAGHIHDAPSSYDSLKHQRLATSHIPEWLMHLPEELTVPDEVVHRAGRWLFRQWRNVHDESFVAENFCPCSHAAAVLGVLCDME
jgi:hypothetical protein